MVWLHSHALCSVWAHLVAHVPLISPSLQREPLRSPWLDCNLLSSSFICFSKQSDSPPPASITRLLASTRSTSMLFLPTTSLFEGQKGTKKHLNVLSVMLSLNDSHKTLNCAAVLIPFVKLSSYMLMFCYQFDWIEGCYAAGHLPQPLNQLCCQPELHISAAFRLQLRWFHTLLQYTNSHLQSLPILRLDNLNKEETFVLTYE